MRKMLLLAAAAVMVPGAVSAQSTMNAPTANQADSQTTTNAQSGMGDTANPMASDTNSQAQGSTMSSDTSAAGGASTSATDATSSAGMSNSATAAGSSADMSSSAATDTSSPSASMNKTYPTCSRTLRDSCRNPGGK